MSIAKSSPRTKRICAISLVVLFLLWPHALQYLFSAIQRVLISLFFLVVFNIFILYIYMRHFVSPKKETYNDFRPLRFTHHAAWAAWQQSRSLENTPDALSMGGIPNDNISRCNNEGAIAAAFDELVSNILRDFVDYWFTYLAKDEASFHVTVDRLMHEAALALKRRIDNADLFGILVNRLIPVMTRHISDFRAAEMALRGRSLERSVTQTDELDLLLASQFRSGYLHPALTTAAVSTTKATEVHHLRSVVARILPYIFDKNELDSRPISIIFRELLACAALQPVLDMVADPDFWNQSISAYLGKAIREQKMVHKLREVLNRHSTAEFDVSREMDMETQTTPAMPSDEPGTIAPPSLPHQQQQQRSAGLNTIMTSLFSSNQEDEHDRDLHPQECVSSINMGRRSYHDFLRMIEDENSLLELKRARNDIVTQLRKKRVLIQDRDPEEVIDGEKVQDIIVYIDRLSVAKRRVDKRITDLTGENDDKKKSPFFRGASLTRSRQKRSDSVPQPLPGFSLQDILTNTAGLSYFMEFMDRRGDMMKLQFWLLVEGFKNTDLTYHGDGCGSKKHSSAKMDQSNLAADKTFFQDVKMVYALYLSENAPHRLALPKRPVHELYQSVERTQQCLDSDQLQQEDIFHGLITHVRQRLYQIQKQVFQQIDKDHFPYFKRSDLYFKYLATTPNAAPDTVPGNLSHDNISAPNHPNPDPLPQQMLSPTDSVPPLISASSSTSSSTSLLRPRLIERTTSASLAHRKSVWSDNDGDTSVIAMDSQRSKADSDSEATSPTKKTRGSTVHKHSDRSTTMPPLSSVSRSSESQHPQHTVSDSTRISNASRLLGFGKMVDSANGWWRTSNPADWISGKARKDADPAKKDTSAPPSRTQSLVRSNTIQAVEAELHSIIDWTDEGPADGTLVTDGQEKELEQKSAPPSPFPSSRLHKHHDLLLHSTKSSTALPIQNDSNIESRPSLRGSNVVQQVAHDIPEDLSRSSSSLPSSSSIQSLRKEQDVPNVHLAPPGDLMLGIKVTKLSEELEKLAQQQAIVDELIKKAERDGNDMDTLLRILKKSKNMFQREMQQLRYQKSQYELQVSENMLAPDRTRVSLTSSTIGSDNLGEFALYVIEVQQLNADGNYGSGWIVARRYSEFFALHSKLKEKYPGVKMLDFPSKWPLLRLQKPFVEARRTNLERYLRHLLEDRAICQSEELRAFLSQQNIYVPGPDQYPSEPTELGFFTSVPRLSEQKSRSGKAMMHQQQLPDHLQLKPSSSSSSTTSSKSLLAAVTENLASHNQVSEQQDLLYRNTHTGFMKHIYQTVAEGVDDLVIAPSMLDLIIQRLGDQVMCYFNDTVGSDPTPAGATTLATASTVADGDDGSAGMATDHLSKSTTAAMALSEGVTKFTEPLCDLFIEMFELKEKNNWLRRQAVVIVLQQILGGTIERKLRDTVHFLTTEPMVVFYLKKVTTSLWPDGQKLTFKSPRRPEEKQHAKDEANRKLSAWLPDLLGQMVGRQNARRGARRLFSVLQNKRLNQDLVYTLFDEVVLALFPELEVTDAS
ncbi:PXA domain-containing protein [Dichotomocladium elegans]|nr:PXA domain-containing protein [Dichotomocladium elegans]